MIKENNDNDTTTTNNNTNTYITTDNNNDNYNNNNNNKCVYIYIYIYTYIDMHRHRCIHTCYTYIVSYDSIHSTVYRIILHYTGARLLPGAPSGPRRSVARC